MRAIWRDESTARGVSDAGLAAWEKRHGHKLPAVLETLLRQHNGGVLERLDDRWNLVPLAAMKPVNTRYLKDVWQSHDSMDKWREDLEKAGIPGKTQLYPLVTEYNNFCWFAWLEDITEPVVISRNQDAWDFTVEKTLDAWCREHLAPVPSPQPGFAWNETAAVEILFAGKGLSSDGTRLHQVLGRKDGRLWLYTHEECGTGNAAGEETYEKEMLPEPLNPAHCGLSKKAENWRLVLTPLHPDGSEVKVFRRTPRSGGWLEDFSTDPGACLESPDRQKLESVRRLFFSEKEAAAADQQEELNQAIQDDRDAKEEQFEARIAHIKDLPTEELHKSPAATGRIMDAFMELFGGTDLLESMQQYCRDHGIVEPPGLSNRMAKRHAVIRRDRGAPGIVALTWSTLAEAADYVRKNPPPQDRDDTVEILDFEKRNRYGWSTKGPVLNGNF